MINTTNQTSDDNNQQKPPQLFAWIAGIDTIVLIITTQIFRGGINPYLRGIGVLVLLLAGVFIFTPLYLLSKNSNVKEGQSYVHARSVVNNGLYAITRHPQYLGYIFLGCGFALISQHYVTVLLAAISLICFNQQAIREEEYCLRQFGESYNYYLQQVPRFNIVNGIIRVLHS